MWRSTTEFGKRGSSAGLDDGECSVSSMPDPSWKHFVKVVIEERQLGDGSTAYLKGPKEQKPRISRLFTMVRMLGPAVARQPLQATGN